MPILCLFLAEFHTHVGHHLTFQVPQNFISKEFFSNVSDFIVAAPDFCNKMITLVVSNYQILGFPMRLENLKYSRNELLFNVGMVLSEDTDAAPYEAIVRKLALCIRGLEVDSGYLFNKKFEPRVQAIITRVFKDVNATGKCDINIDPENFLSLRLLHPCRVPSCPVRNHEVPIVLRRMESPMIDTWDLALRKVVPHIDGIKTVQRIADVANMEERMVQECIRQLLCYKFVEMVDVFLFSNEYCLTERFPLLLPNEAFQKNFLEFVRADTTQVTPSMDVCVRILSAMEPGVPMRSIALSCDLARWNVDLRRVVVFCVMSGVLRRIHKYPLMIGPTSDEEEEPDLSQTQFSQLITLCDGKHSLDELSVRFRRSDLARFLQHVPNCVIVSK